MARLIEQRPDGWYVVDTNAERDVSGPHATEGEADRSTTEIWYTTPAGELRGVWAPIGTEVVDLEEGGALIVFWSERQPPTVTGSRVLEPTEAARERAKRSGPVTLRKHQPGSDEATGWNMAVECFTEAFCAVAPYLRDGDEPQGPPAQTIGAMFIVMLEDSIEVALTRAHVLGARDFVQALAYFLDGFDPMAPRGAEMAVTDGEEEGGA